MIMDLHGNQFRLLNLQQYVLFIEICILKSFSHLIDILKVLSNAKINTQKFTMSYYNPLPTTTLTSLSLPSGWTG